MAVSTAGCGVVFLRMLQIEAFKLCCNNKSFLIVPHDAEECTYPSGVSEEMCFELFNCGKGFEVDDI